jgi:hypothetical protein
LHPVPYDRRACRSPHSSSHCSASSSATLSLAWQAAVHLLTGARIRVELRVGAGSRRDGDPRRPARLSTDRATTWRSRVARGRSSPFRFGRMPVVVERWASLLHHPGITFYPLADSIGPGLPFLPEPGHSQTWSAGSCACRRPGWRHRTGVPPPQSLSIIGRVELGDGRRQDSGERLLF